jgi:hypothetical protein
LEQLLASTKHAIHLLRKQIATPTGIAEKLLQNTQNTRGSYSSEDILKILPSTLRTTVSADKLHVVSF